MKVLILVKSRIACKGTCADLQVDIDTTITSLRCLKYFLSDVATFCGACVCVTAPSGGPVVFCFRFVDDTFYPDGMP